MGFLNLGSLFSILLCAICVGCEFKFSPYSIKTPKRLKNQFNLSLIQKQESSIGSNFKIAFISDTHNYYDELNQLINHINSNGPYSFVVVAGDITNYGLLEEYDQILDQLNDLKYPYLVAIGNHDHLSNGDKIFARMFGETDFSFVYKNVNFIFFNNNNWEASGVIPNVQWVESQLIASASPFKILVSHVSPTDRDRFSDHAIDTWENLITRFNVSYVMHGHNHNPGIDTFGTAQMITIGSPSKGSYFELNVTPGGIDHQKLSF